PSRLGDGDNKDDKGEGYKEFGLRVEGSRHRLGGAESGFGGFFCHDPYPRSRRAAVTAACTRVSSIVTPANLAVAALAASPAATITPSRACFLAVAIVDSAALTRCARTSPSSSWRRLDSIVASSTTFLAMTRAELRASARVA